MAKLSLPSALLGSFLVQQTSTTRLYSPGGTDCEATWNSFPACSTDECRAGKTACECDVGGKGAVGAKFCLNGEFVAAWYSGSEDAASQDWSSYTKVLPSRYGSDYSKEEGLWGDVCATTTWNSEESYMYTCKGVEDYKHYMRMVFRGTGCNASQFMYNSTSESNSGNISAFCYRDGDKAPTSECGSCDSSDPACDTEDECKFARRLWNPETLCSYSGGVCSCKSKNYKLGPLCVGGQQVYLFYKTSTRAACLKKTDWYMKALTEDMGDGVCKGSSRQDSGITHMQRGTCAGVADLGLPKLLYFNKSDCSAASVVSENSDKALRYNCDCMAESEPIRSQCRSCVDTTCNLDAKSCTLAESNACAYDAGAKSCSCASNNWKSERVCWEGKSSELLFKNVDRSKCLSPTAADVVLAAPENPDEEDGVQCKDTTDGRYPTAKKRIERSCTGVANGKKPQTVFYSDDKCTVKVANSEWEYEGSELCKCEKWLGCEKGTKFEKYFCDASGKIIKQEFSDSWCTVATGTNTTVDSFTDAGKQGECMNWPPVFLDPTSTAMVNWTCTPGKDFPSYAYYPTGNGKCSGEASRGDITSCNCVDELMFNKKAAAANTLIKGELSMEVSDVAAVLQDDTFKALVKDSIADTAGVPAIYVADLKLSAARRLAGLAADSGVRRLASGAVKAEYTIVAPKAMESKITTAVKATDVQTSLQQDLEKKVAGAGLSYTVTVKSVSVPTAQAATPANMPDASGSTADGPDAGTASSASQVVGQGGAMLVFAVLTLCKMV
eukprot:TRINITY_DN2428_c0_g1_i7.p1 TRINITY_DN2428_c0_g1~~TRINITY_DN2428_c0_g1_i7.p1  ORF type:complete len:781 (+),score=140.33 TRINITY_DN2428_c0_g1_i7:99-2441(+)